MEGVRKQFLGAFCKESGLHIKHCNSMEVFIFNFGMENETGFLKCDFGSIDAKTIKLPNGTLQLPKEFNNLTPEQRREALIKMDKEIRNVIDDVLSGKPELLDDEDRAKFTDLIPKIEAEVRRKSDNKDFKVIDTVSLIKNISVFANFQEWYFELSYEFTDPSIPKQKERYPKPKSA
jgi:hypothetical protein